MESLEKIMKKCLKRHKTEITVLWLIISIGVVLILSGIGIYFYVGKLIIAQEISKIPVQNYIVSQVKMLCNFSKALGVVFSLVGIVSIIFS